MTYIITCNGETFSGHIAVAGQNNEPLSKLVVTMQQRLKALFPQADSVLVSVK